MKKKSNKKVKRHIKWKAFFIFLFVVIIITSLVYYFWNLPIKNIYITGNESLKDYEIIEIAGLKDYPKMNKYSNKVIEKNIKELDLVDTVKVKKDILGKIKIEIK